MKKFSGSYLRELRRKKGLQQVEVGRAVGVSGSAVGNWERGVAAPSGPVVDKLAMYFNVPAENFWLDESKPEGSYIVRSEGDLLRACRDMRNSGAKVEFLPTNYPDAVPPQPDSLVRITFPLNGGRFGNARLEEALKALGKLFEVDDLASTNVEVNEVTSWSSIIDGYLNTAAASLDNVPLYKDDSSNPYASGIRDVNANDDDDGELPW